MEICFCGRSNVGKSSLLNRLVQRRALARVSNTPGRTQAINVFAVTLLRGEQRREVHFVDLPGYGFAKAPESVRKAWRPMMESYFRRNSHLRAAVSLFDVRREPSGQDLDFVELMGHFGIPALPVVTKIDKEGLGRRAAAMKAIAEALGIEDWRALHAVSAQTSEGIPALLEALWEVTDPPAADKPEGEHAP
jgi:GTP-binding protein